MTEVSITAVALDLIDREGLEKFSLRNLAAALGVYPSAVYWYLPSKDAVAAAVMSMVSQSGPFVIHIFVPLST